MTKKLKETNLTRTWLQEALDYMRLLPTDSSADIFICLLRLFDNVKHNNNGTS